MPGSHITFPDGLDGLDDTEQRGVAFGGSPQLGVPSPVTTVGRR
jgi:hypothetical protein